MTKQEKNYCEKLIKEAKKYWNIAKENFEKYDKYVKAGKEIDKKIDMQCTLRDAEYNQGYAEGIYQALVWIGYNSENMKELTEQL